MNGGVDNLWEITLDGEIWNYFADPVGAILAVELRNPAGEARLVSLDKATGRILAEFTPEEPRKLALRGICQGLLLVSLYRDLSRPDAQDLLAYLPEGQLKWWRGDCSLQHIDNGLIIGRDTAGVGIALDGNGQPAALPQPGPAMAEWFASYTPSSPYWLPMVEIIRQQVALEPVERIDCLETAAYTVLKFYTVENTILGHFIVMDLNGAIIRHYALEIEPEGFMAGTFIMDSEGVTYRRNQARIGRFTFL